jgi:1-aminocyclopropane-1-carboxylate deaminase
VPDVLATGCDTLVSIGGVQSNHTRQVAAVAAKLGLKCVLVQGSWVDWPDGVYDRVGNILLSRVLGAQLDFSKEDFSIAIKQSWEQALDRVRRAGGKPYAIPAGASDHPLGGLGYVGFAEELRAQERTLGFRFDFILVASGSGSTQAGMVVGFAADGRADRVIGIDITAKPQEARAQVKRIAGRTADLVGARPRRHRCRYRARRALRLSGLRRAGGRDPSTRSGSARGSKACSPIRSMRANRCKR